ncbi:MAG: DUF1894 domain-containing protein [Methanospirillum sp.]|mgnify:CR=1 FL=1|nr:DUF1894 domain-containing protein [Methanospirillum sp.]
MSCIDQIEYEIILSGASFREGAEYIRKHFGEHYEVDPGYRLFDAHLIGVPPVVLGVDAEDVIFPYTKPCRGTFLLRARGPEEIARLRARKK